MGRISKYNMNKMKDLLKFGKGNIHLYVQTNLIQGYTKKIHYSFWEWRGFSLSCHFFNFKLRPLHIPM